jgi:hypothetical protein
LESKKLAATQQKTYSPSSLRRFVRLLLTGSANAPMRCGTRRVLGAFSIRGAPVRLLPRKTISWLFGELTGLLIVLVSFAVIAQTQPGPPLRDGLPRQPRLTLTAQDEYGIRENLLTDSSLPRESSTPDTIGDVVPQTIKLYPMPSEIVQKVPKAQGHQFVVKDDNTVILVSSSDRPVVDDIKKKPSD